jgi:hypothetical protein
LKNAAGKVSVETALAQVRALADRPTSTNASLVAAMEVLSDIAIINEHVEREHFKIALKAVRQREHVSTPLHGLIVKLIGSDVSKKVNSSVDSWLKANKRLTSSDLSLNPQSNVFDQFNRWPYNASNQFSNPQNQNWQYPSQQMTPGSFRGGRWGRPQRFRGPPRFPTQHQPLRACYACKATDHLMDKCPKITALVENTTGKPM